MQDNKDQSEQIENAEQQAPKGSMGMGIVVGIVMGTAYGIMSGKFAEGLATGIALGIILGGVLQFNARMQKHQQQQDKDN